MTAFTLSQTQIEGFQRDGYVAIAGLFDKEEMDLLLATAKGDRELEKNSYGRKDAAGGVSKLALWNHPGDDLYGLIARSHRVVDSMGRLLGDEVYHWHSKMMLKEPRTGGAWEWHQDYGYWYDLGCLYPYIVSFLIPFDPPTK